MFLTLLRRKKASLPKVDLPTYTITSTIRWRDRDSNDREFYHTVNLTTLDVAKASRRAWASFNKHQGKDWSGVFNPKISCELVGELPQPSQIKAVDQGRPAPDRIQGADVVLGRFNIGAA